jgi:peptidoglycan L-alanyl-D-glutamate endopeptidase CwlK
MRTFDERTERNIATLLPAAQGRFRDFIGALQDAGIDARIISGSRTWAEQDALFAIGRTKPGDKVTNAKGGQSRHNYGIAADIGIFQGTDYLEDSPLYDKAGTIGKKMGLDWGGDWKGGLVDKPHFEFPTGLTIAQLRQHMTDGIPILPEPPKPAQEWRLEVDGKPIDSPVLIEGRLYAPVRALCEAVGVSVAPDSAAKVARVTTKGGEK